MDLSYEETNRLLGSIAHLFLPKRTPEAEQSNLQQIEQFILETVTQSVSKAVEKSSLIELNSLLKTLETWEVLQSTLREEPENFKKAFIQSINDLEVSTVPIYVRKQNATVIFEKDNDSGTILMETFRSSLPTKVVMGNVHELQMNFPETSNPVQNMKFLHSEKCAEILYELSTEDFPLSTQQISRHSQSFDDVRNAAEPFLVIDFLVGLLCPNQQESGVNKTLQPVFKKIRDQITLKAADHSSSLQPFRRTGLWMSLKVTIQLKLQRILKNDQLSKIVYKILMLQVNANVCKMYFQSRSTHTIEFDLMAQMLIKLERRTDKLQKLFPELLKALLEDSLSNVEEKIKTLKDSTLDSASKTMKELNQFMTASISSLDKERQVKLPPRTIDEYLNDLNHDIPSLSKTQEELKDGIAYSKDHPSISSDIQESLELQRFPNSDSVINGANCFSRMKKNQQLIWLHDTEAFLKTKLLSEPDSSKILKIVCNYVKFAVGIYKVDNPLGGSQLILSVLKAVEELDKRARRLYPLLNQYKTGIENLSRLVLPHKDDINLLEEALDYFEAIDSRVPNRLKECSILTEKITPISFSVRFAEDNEEMMRMLNKVRAQVEVHISKKLEEFQRVKKECEEINEKMIAEGDCSCEYETRNLYSRRWRKHYTKRVKIRTCLRCIYRKELEAKETSVSVYERPLPIEDHLQKAIMFELFIPQEISQFRDALQILLEGLIKTSGFLKGSGQITSEWVNFDKLRGNLDRSPTNDFSLVKFGSKHLSYSRTRYSKSNPNLLYATEDSIICKCWLDCSYSFKFFNEAKLPSFALSFELKYTDNSDHYKVLQPQLSSWKHSQNLVLCSQYACSKKLSFNEFITFGSIRAGHRIQLRNLYRAISSKSLSLSKEPVVALILQTIWQLGPRNSNRKWEAHEDFTDDPQFCQEFLTLLGNLMEENESNYTYPCILLCAIAITVRIMELTSHDEVRKRGNDLLREWRKLIKKWTSKVEGEIQKGRGSSGVRNVPQSRETRSSQTLKNLYDDDDALFRVFPIHPPFLGSSSDPSGSFSSQWDLEGLEKTLLVIRICSAFSYNFSPSKDWNSVFATEDDLVEWFHTVYYLNQKGSLNLSDFSFIQILLNQARHLAYQLNLESKANDPLITSALRKFTGEKWNKAMECSMEPTIQYKTQENLAELKFMKETDLKVDCVTFDFLLGSFLVNGFPAKFLPAGVTSHRQFTRFFGETNAKLAVQPETINLFHTIDKFHGSQFEFSLKGNDLRITEITEDKKWRVLLESELFEGYLHPFFIKNFTHWLSLLEEVVYFKRMCQQDSDFDLKPEYKLIKENSTWKLFDENNQGYLLSIQSKGFLSLARFLSMSELSKHVNVLMTDQNEIVAYLPRQTLRFKLNPNNVFESVEYPGYYLNEDEESLKTLTGLQQGILLRKGEKRILLLPHGNIHLERRPYHHKTIIALDKLHSPPYFVYEVDEVLKRLKGNMNRLSYLYLAYLHALTSLTSCLPDAFTELTGTEMALRILQYGFMWSSSPYDEDCKKYLHLIQKLSPKRTCYGHKFSSWGYHDNAEEVMAGSEMVEWPEILPTMSAYDGFHLIVHKLIKDSEKLAVLHKREETEDNNSLSVRIQSNDKQSPRFLRYRAYLKYLNLYNHLAKLELDIIPSKYLNLTKNEIVLESKQRESCNMGALCIAAYLQNTDKLMKHSMFNPTSFISFLLQPHKILNEFLPSWYSTLKEMLCFDFRGSWFQLYKMASKKDKTSEEKQSFALLLSTLAYQKASLPQLLIFHYLINFSDFDFPELPNPLPSPQRNVPAEDPSEDELQTDFEMILTRNKICQPRKYCPTEEEKEEIEKVKLIVENALEEAKIFIVEELLKSADASTGSHRLFTKQDLKSLPVEYFQVDSILVEINATVETINTDKMLRNFCKKLEMELKNKYGALPEADDQLKTFKASAKEVNSVVKIIVKDNPSLGRFNVEERELEIWEIAEKIFLTGEAEEETELTTSSSLEEFKKERRRLEEVVSKVKDSWVKTTGSNQENARLSSRADPTSLIRILLHQGNIEFNQTSKIYTGALAVLWTKIKRLSRCIAVKLGGNESELEKELANKGHVNWSPKKFPEWLCLELELDLMIRSQQVDVARQMIKMPRERNGVLQLNMGEGKTSVIVPMLCCVIGKKKVLCRVTVLSSMINMNEKILGFAIGGLINKRVYLMPCKRDLNISIDTVQTIQQSLEECMKGQGVLLTLPEHRLSFRLLAYDNAFEEKNKPIKAYSDFAYSKLDMLRKMKMKKSSRNKKTVKKSKELGLQLWQTENWLRKHARDVLDESDELLNAKYQLVYTVGEKIDLDGGRIRWICAKNLLKIVKSLGKTLHEEHGDSVVEWDGKENKPHEFPVFRLLDTSANEELITKVGKLLLEEFTLDSKEKERVKRFLVDKEGDFEKISTIFQEENASKEVDKLLTYAGYLGKGILTLGLFKRWRVEYGVDTDKTFSLMAVPFRAKDFPAERTEFGHPDLAILLTHLSYYYSGLSDLQLEETWEVLKEKRDSESIYASWLGKCNPDSVPGHLWNFKGINLKDSEQKEDLFKLLRRHVSAIDFFLDNEVFPMECKQFPSKLVMTSWDLCYEKNKHPTTGFSGTNDSSILLPLQITQQDLQALKNTNEKMEKTLLKSENKGHWHLRMGVTCEEILQQMKKDNLRVLIDAGALMLKLNNDQVAKLWLDLDKSLEGVLYFSKRNELTVKCRVSGSESKDIPLELTPYQNSLEKVGVFLDDQHTRGTDLKFPNEWRAVVTIGAGMTRDKLTQACMRMRKLEFNQSVSFCLSHEVFDKIKKMKGTETMEEISTYDVLQWVQQNTDKFNEDGLLYWAISGKNYAQRLAAEEFYLNETRGLYSTQRNDNSNLKDKEKAFQDLAKRCVDDEVTKLMTLYGKRSTVKNLYNITPFWFNHSLKKIKRFRNSYEERKIEDLFKGIRNGVTLRCWKHVPNKLHLYSIGGESLEEEQVKELELELEREVEEERIVERPRNVKHADPNLHENVLKIVKSGEEVKAMDGIQIVPEIFKNTTFWGKVQPNAWSQNVFASTDFITVLEMDPERNVENLYYRKPLPGRTNTDLFLRPVEFFIVCKGEVPTILFLSSFEVNELLPLFRQGKAKLSLHMFSSTKSQGQSLLWENPGLTLNTPEMTFSPNLEMYSLPTILLAAGNLYFSCMEEQKLFVEFLCLAPKPWGKKEEEGFEKGEITKKGFMLPGYEGRRDGKEEEVPEGFKVDPEGLLGKILSCRHSVLSEISHVVRILNERRLINMQ